MGMERPEAALPMLEMSCPEYFVTDIGKIEHAGGGNLRVWCCVRRGNVLEPVYTVVIPHDLLSQCARTCLQAAADVHNQITFRLPLSAH